MKKQLFHKDFTLMVVGQVISIFGNSILRFALSLYVLDMTGSATIFASILAISMLPTILLSPFGGILSDRLPRKMIMVILDFITSCCILVFTLLQASDEIITIIGGFMVLLSVIQSFYQPAVQASIPSITAQENLTAANGITTSINALANLIGPVLGGLLYGFFGISWILSISATCFFLSAVLELFLHIPFVKQARTSSLVHMIKADFQEAFHFIIKENPIICKLLVAVAGLNLFITAMLQVGLPYMIRIQLGLSSQLYGFAESSMAIGMMIGSAIAMKLGNRINIKTSYLPLLIGSACMIPIGISILTTAYPLPSYIAIVASILISMSFIAVFNIVVQAYMQAQTPVHLLGKVSSFIMTIVMCAVPIGQALYGVFFDVLGSNCAWIVIVACMIAFGLSMYVKTVLRRLQTI